MKRIIVVILTILVVFGLYSWIQRNRAEDNFTLPERFDEVGDLFDNREVEDDHDPNEDPKSDESDRTSKEDYSEILEILSEKLSTSTSSIQILNTEDVEWPNGCLGLAEPLEGCTQAIVPGLLIEIRLEDKTYFYRTNEDLSVIREQKE